MKYRVAFTASASADAEDAYEWIKERAPSAAIKWFNGLLDVVETLEAFPARCGVAPESDHAGDEIRQLLYGKRPHLYRILFTIRSDVVYVLHVRHGARRTMQRDEIQYPNSPTE